MRLHSILLGAAAAVLFQATGAQSQVERRPVDRAPRPPRVMVIGGADTRAVLGITVSTSGSARDTLGLLVNSVVPGGPADRAGISEGNRLAEINGIRLRLYPGDVGQSEAGDMMMRRLTNELRRVRPGDEVTLRVYADGRFRTVTVQTGDAAAIASGRPRPAPGVTVEAERADQEKLEREKQEKAERVKTQKLEHEKQEKAEHAGAGAQPTLDAIVQAMGELQAQVRKLLQEEGPGALRRALDNADQQIHELQRQLREIQAERQRAAEEARLAEEARKAEEARRAEEAARAAERTRLEREAEEARSARRDEGDWTGLSGLRVTRISEDLAAYFGEGSERGLLVLEADPSWEPLRAGDIILRVNGARIYSADRLGNQLDPRQENTVEVLRRGRSLTMTVGRRRR